MRVGIPGVRRPRRHVSAASSPPPHPPEITRIRSIPRRSSPTFRGSLARREERREIVELLRAQAPGERWHATATARDARGDLVARESCRHVRKIGALAAPAAFDLVAGPAALGDEELRTVRRRSVEPGRHRRRETGALEPRYPPRFDPR